MAAGLAAALAFPSAVAACTVEEYMTAEEIASGRYDVTPPDTYGGGPAGPHTHGEVAAPPADPAAAQPGSTPAATAAPTPPPAVAAPAPVTKPPAADAKTEVKTQDPAPSSERDAPAAKQEPARKDTAPAATKPRRTKPSPQPATPPQAAPAPAAQAPVLAVAPPPPPRLEPAAQPTSRPEAERTRRAADARGTATSRPSRPASRDRPAPVALPAHVALHRQGPVGEAPTEPVRAPHAGDATPADGGGQDPTAIVAGIIGLIGGAVAVLAWRRRPRAAAVTPIEPLDDDVEAELQKLLSDEGRGSAVAAGHADERSSV